MTNKKTRRRVHKQRTKQLFDKYDFYKKSVQSPDVDVAFFRKVYRELRLKEPKVFREDFAGTFATCCEWVKLNPKYQAYALDIDPEPLTYGFQHYMLKLKDQQRKRVHPVETSVLQSGLPRADIVAAMNFSYFVFRQRKMMKQYFQNVYKSLKPNGIFIMDCFGGSGCYDENEEVTNFRTFKYFWHQRNFDPVSNRAKFNIHFKMPGTKKLENVFTYDWRMWTIPELKDILEEVGFKRSHVYWEGSNKKGEGNGVFTRVEKGEECESWIAYIVGEK
jgi:SAM-dependent methyltransferase